MNTVFLSYCNHLLITSISSVNIRPPVIERILFYTVYVSGVCLNPFDKKSITTIFGTVLLLRNGSLNLKFVYLFIFIYILIKVGKIIIHHGIFLSITHTQR